MPHTHDVEIVGDVVRKTYVCWSHGEPEREWAGLVHLSAHAPGLAPRPISRLVSEGRPVVVMSRVRGRSHAGRLSPGRTESLAAAVQRLFAVPVPEGLATRANEPVGFRERFRPSLSEEHEWTLCQDPDLVRETVDVARDWLDEHPTPPDWLVDPVVALGDGNLDNVLWDGETCHLVDWEEYGASDLAYEVADLVEHVSSRLGRHLDVPGLLGRLDLDAAQRDRVEHHRRMFACFWLALLLPGNRAWSRNPPGSTEDQARHLVGLVGR